jgi:hypothetical protein
MASVVPHASNRPPVPGAAARWPGRRTVVSTLAGPGRSTAPGREPRGGPIRTGVCGARRGAEHQDATRCKCGNHRRVDPTDIDRRNSSSRSETSRSLSRMPSTSRPTAQAATATTPRTHDRRLRGRRVVRVRTSGNLRSGPGPQSRLVRRGARQLNDQQFGDAGQRDRTPEGQKRLGQRQVACASLQDGTVKCWGHVGSGELGVPPEGQAQCPFGEFSGACSTIPRTVKGVSDVTSVSTAQNHVRALLRTGTVECWGSTR